MEFKWNAFVSAVMFVTVLSVATVNSSIINGPDYEEDSEINYYNGVPVYTPSRECSMAGGICVQEGDCAKGQLAQKPGLCADREMGVECCYEVLSREAPCKQFGGECMDTCSPFVVQSLGNDCGDKKCCILL